MTRSRQRGRRPQSSSHSHNPNRTFDSSGPEVKIRGSASHVYDKYLQMARDANAAGDRIAAENYLQHAEHYYRIMAAAQPQQGRGQGANYNGSERPNSDGMQPAASEPSFSLAEGHGAGGHPGEAGAAE